MYYKITMNSDKILGVFEAIAMSEGVKVIAKENFDCNELLITKVNYEEYKKLLSFVIESNTDHLFGIKDK